MRDFKLNSRSKKEILNSTGMDFDYIVNADVNTVDVNIERKAGTTLIPSFNIGGLLSRGSVYLMFRRILTPDYIAKALSRIKP